jgi:hypothetical protein
MSLFKKMETESIKRDKFIRTDFGNYLNLKYVSGVEHKKECACFHVYSLMERSIGLVCKENNPENYNILKDHIGFNANN